MSDQEVPKRRPTDPKPGTKGPQRGSNDAFTQKMPKVDSEPSKPEPKPYEGWLAKERREGIDTQVKKAVGFKAGGSVRGWGKARKRGC